MNSVLKKEMPNLAVLSNEELKNIDGGVVPLAIAGVVGACYVGGKWVGKKIFK
ncbi:class IIb bacteriocin, lactobin A/cerein 7B family [Bacillus wiedmannii]|uniref:Class IIb bacteriocin, lactobin A/cerein 7B family n=1 Tax=Bacillus wiedmannii TaxID=1890302 RepID=A0A4U2MSI9_9BACI|nr:class IIb bacteriocin, lactobin A/cerein 7B family [Bacillus wiedmannii]TKH14058.1 class IIb bacteriocin, lactobin A/cerein 7B family [Bacillus wiedmannii]TKI89612.1 class IIb bacteriocin, lactobin A/cerein 7B family [Bacillus wiedmannii]